MQERLSQVITDFAQFELRPAAADDYSAFTALFPELQVQDPLPTASAWETAMCPTTFVAVRANCVVGYCYFQEYADTGYVRNVVVAPSARNAGIGLALMCATRERLRSHGKRSWRLNVRPENHAALALYARVGLALQHLSHAIRFPWASLPAFFPAAVDAVEAVDAVNVRELPAERDAACETRFDLHDGQLSLARRAGKLVLEAIAEPGSAPIGVAVFEPKFPGAFPFRVTRMDAVPALLAAMRLAAPGSAAVTLVIENDRPLATALEAAGATVVERFLHFSAALEVRARSA